VDRDKREVAASRVLDAVRGAVVDSRGRWLFAAEHAEGRSEYAITGVGSGIVERVSLDRTFVAEGQRWIVDFKTSAHEGGDRDGFLDREVERYRPQLERYARIVQSIDPRPIMLALYFPLVDGGWRAWAYEPRDLRAEKGEMR
jgi:hypothetical protein